MQVIDKMILEASWGCLQYSLDYPPFSRAPLLGRALEESGGGGRRGRGGLTGGLVVIVVVVVVDVCVVGGSVGCPVGSVEASPSDRDERAVAT